MKSAQEKFQLRDVERGGRASSEVNCRWNEQGAAVSSPPGRSGDRLYWVLFEFPQYCFTKSPGLRPVEQILVKSAVRADTRAERNVNVEVANRFCSGRRVASISGRLR